MTDGRKKPEHRAAAAPRAGRSRQRAKSKKASNDPPAAAAIAISASFVATLMTLVARCCGRTPRIEKLDLFQETVALLLKPELRGKLAELDRACSRVNHRDRSASGDYRMALVELGRIVRKAYDHLDRPHRIFVETSEPTPVGVRTRRKRATPRGVSLSYEPGDGRVHEGVSEIVECRDLLDVLLSRLDSVAATVLAERMKGRADGAIALQLGISESGVSRIRQEIGRTFRGLVESHRRRVPTE